MNKACEPVRTARLGSGATAMAGIVLGAFLLAACGKSDAPGPAPAAVPSAATSPAARSSAPPPNAGLDVCALLTPEQAARVVPGHDGGSAGGEASLIAGVSSRQCNYAAVRGNDVDLLTVIVTVASTDELLAQIRPSGSAFDDQDKVAIADGGWIKRDAADEVEVVASKGRAVLRLTLLAPDAKRLSNAMVELAAAVAARL
jgi:hypothetical protein